MNKSFSFILVTILFHLLGNEACAPIPMLFKNAYDGSWLSVAGVGDGALVVTSPDNWALSETWEVAWEDALVSGSTFLNYNQDGIGPKEILDENRFDYQILMRFPTSTNNQKFLLKAFKNNETGYYVYQIINKESGRCIQGNNVYRAVTSEICLNADEMDLNSPQFWSAYTKDLMAYLPQPEEINI